MTLLTLGVSRRHKRAPLRRPIALSNTHSQTPHTPLTWTGHQPVPPQNRGCTARGSFPTMRTAQKEAHAGSYSDEYSRRHQGAGYADALQPVYRTCSRTLWMRRRVPGRGIPLPRAGGARKRPLPCRGASRYIYRLQCGQKRGRAPGRHRCLTLTARRGERGPGQAAGRRPTARPPAG